MRASRVSTIMPRVLLMIVTWLSLLLVVSCEVGDAQEPAAPNESGQQSTMVDFRNDINAAIATAQQYWSDWFTAHSERFEPLHRVIPYQRDGQISCGDQPLDLNNAEYCTDGDFIAFDINWAFQANNEIGDAFVYYFLDHEYGHAIQVRLGTEYRFTIQQELQADCLSGAVIGDSVRAGRLQLEQGDLDELRKGLAAVADQPDQPWFSQGAHGDVEQRTDAFFTGYDHSVPACGLS
jgi:uncharacterized protein